MKNLFIEFIVYIRDLVSSGEIELKTIAGVIILVFFLAFFLMIGIILRRFNSSLPILKRRSINFIFLVILSLGIFYVLRGFLIIFFLYVYPEYKFDKVEWHSNPDVQYQWSKDIIESKMLVGKTKTDIVSLLGSEFYTFKKDSTTEVVTYHIGFRPFKIDLEVLTIIIQDGKVVEVKKSTN